MSKKLNIFYKRVTRREFIKKSLLVLAGLGIGVYAANKYLNLNLLQRKKLMTGKYNKILIIGIDGMDPKITNKLMLEGKLSNFKKLKGIGSYTTIHTSLPPHSPVAWTTIATGTNPGKHNIFDFIRRDPARQLPELSLAKSKTGIAGTDYESYIKADPFWRLTSKADIPTTIIRWPVTFPPERIEGNLLSGLGVPDMKGLLGGYTFYTTADFDKNDETSENTVAVEDSDGVIKTSISGPNIRKSSGVTSIKVSLKIDLKENSAIITVQGSKYPVNVNGWSDWIRIKFKTSLFKNVYGICKVYLTSIKPDFNLYVTDVQIDPENPFLNISYPDEYSAELAKKIGPYNTLGIPEDTAALIDGKLTDKSFLEQCNQIEEERDKMFWGEFKKFNNGILAFVYDTPDRLHHTHWDEKLLIKDDGKFSINKAIVDYYIGKDAFLGKVLSQIDDKTALIVLSDHGFTSFERNVDINSWLSKNGFMTLTQEPNEKNSGELFEYVNWNKTKAYSLGFSSIYLNIKGRESKGIIDKSEREKVMEELIQKLGQLIDPKTKKKVIARLYKREDVYHGNSTANGPDVMVGFNPGYRVSWQTALGGVTPEIIFDNKKVWNGEHLVDPEFVPGVLFTNFKINEKTPHLMDIAPTILKLVGLGIPKEIDGKSLV